MPTLISNKKYKIIIPIAVVLIGIVFSDKLISFYRNFQNHNAKVLSQIQLAKFNGIEKKKLYLALMGSVFDVTKGGKHYEKGASYNYFIGKDGTRSFITGNFRDESETKDHVLDMPCKNLLLLSHWQDTFNEKYEYVGLVVGRYYDEIGQETAYLKELNIKIEGCQIEQDMEKTNMKYPPCNSIWEAEGGSRVWCTKASGGISRSWVGVPRQLYVPGNDAPRCVCVNTEEENSDDMIVEYENCPPTSASCNVYYD